jgi:uncharacterized metal-binding protein YceD (DUF177 family)
MAIIIEPWRIPEDGADMEGEEPATSLDLGDDDLACAVGPIEYALHVQCLGQELIVTGTVGVRAGFVCSRCAVRFEADVQDQSLFCERQLENIHAPVDLTGEVRESIILAFPTYPLCQPACRGLCLKCGANRNREQCDCKEEAEPRASVFDSLDGMERIEHGRTQKKKIKK